MAGEDQVKKFFSSISPRKKQPGESKGLQKVQSGEISEQARLC